MMKVILALMVVITTSVQASTVSVWFRTAKIEEAKCHLIRPVAETQHHRGLASRKTLLIQQAEHVETDELMTASETTYELFGRTKESLTEALVQYCPNGIEKEYETERLSEFIVSAEQQVQAADEIVKLVDSGDPANRIDIVLMGDGYTLAERDLFFEDMKRMTNDMFQAQTFAPYLPLFNIWGLFRPSRESGLGVGGRAKNTAFGLYRDGTELRGVYCSKTWTARRACKAVGKFACDFPSLIANDPYYGGLGGEFTISTSSPTSGSMVLRHEMGHNFGKVGEEYDGGYVYSGANSIRSTGRVSWSHWMPKNTPVRVEDAVLLVQKYPWYNLAQNKYTVEFKSSGKYSRWYMIISLSGMDEPDSFSITLDGKPLEWTSTGIKDRKFFKWHSKEGFSAGSHEIVMQTNTKDTKLGRQLCSLTLHEYKAEDEFQMDDNNAISLYPTWDIRGTKSYRPNNNKCLMRNMASPDFCVVCEENMWMQFLNRVSLIDDVNVNKMGKSTDVEVRALPLGQLRAENDPYRLAHPEKVAQERYIVRWTKNGRPQPQYDDLFKVKLTPTEPGKWTVNVEFQTSMVRSDPKRLLFDSKSFNI